MEPQNTKKERYFEVYYEMFKHEKFKGLSLNGIILYSMMANQVGLSKRPENVEKYTDAKGKTFILFTERQAKEKLGISKGTFFNLKKQLKELKLIDYQEQADKKKGVSTPIYVTPFETWKKVELEESIKFLLPDFY